MVVCLLWLFIMVVQVGPVEHLRGTQAKDNNKNKSNNKKIIYFDINCCIRIWKDGRMQAANIIAVSTNR